jgi:hypothetical protein
MKKYIFVLLLTMFSMSNQQGTFGLSFGIIGYAQSYYSCPNNPNNGSFNSLSGTSSTWWGNFTGWLGNVFGSIGNSIGELFRAGNPNGPYANNSWPDAFYAGSYFNNYYNANYLFIASGGSGTETITTNTNTINTPIVLQNPQVYKKNGKVYWSYDGPDGLAFYINPFTEIDIFNTTYPYDCAGVINGAAIKDHCGTCVSGTTGQRPCNEIDPLTISDTLVATPVDCDSIDQKINRRSAKSDLIWNAIKDSPSVRNAIDSAPYRRFEVGLTIVEQRPFPNTSLFKPTNYNKQGQVQNVEITQQQNSVADFHIHPDSNNTGNALVASPSPADIKGLLASYVDSFYFIGSGATREYNTFQRSFVASGDASLSQWTLVIADTSKAKNFAGNSNFNSNFNPPGSQGGSNNWSGAANDPTSRFATYLDIVKQLKGQGYARDLIETYANVIMLNRLNTGVKMQQKVGNSFKELEVLVLIDPVTSKETFKIIICR